MTTDLDYERNGSRLTQHGEPCHAEGHRPGCPGRAGGEHERESLADRYALRGPAIGDELRVLVGRSRGRTLRVLAIHGRTIVGQVGRSPLRAAYGRLELAPIGMRVRTGR